MQRTRRVADVVAEAELLRLKAMVYSRLRCFVMTHFTRDNGDHKIPWSIISSVSEQLLIEASRAQQAAEALMAQQVVTRQSKH